MKIFFEKDNTVKNTKYNGTVAGLLEKLKINIEDVIIVRDNTVILGDEKINDKESINILNVMSGG